MIPFQDVLEPLVESAKGRLLNIIPSTAIPPDGTLAMAELNLLESLSILSGQSLLLEFWIHTQSKGVHNLKGSSEFSTDRYANFVKELQQEGLEKTFLRYSELGRLVRLTVDQWVVNTSELIIRLYQDMNELHRFFFYSANLGNISAISTGFSDRHRGGRTVARITFSSGKNIWYKPKNIDIDHAYNEFVGWCNREFGWALKTVKVLPCRDYGWMDDVQPMPCENINDVRRFFENAGLLLSVIYILRGADLHSENLVACGIDPVIVDLEMLLQPREQKNSSEQSEKDNFTVQSTGYLPTYPKEDKKLVFDISGLGAKDTVTTPVRGIRWKHINTDKMCLEFIDAPLEKGNHLPDFLGSRSESTEFKNDIARGFEKGYRVFMVNQNKLLEETGPLSIFRNKKIRHLLRPSVMYGSVLRASYNPKYLSSDIERLNRLKSFINLLENKFINSEAKLLADEELNALQQNDIPIFHACSSEMNLLTSHGIVPKFFFEPAFTSVQNGIKRLNNLDLEKQISLILNSLSS